MKTIVVTGPESSGKSTLVKELDQFFESLKLNTGDNTDKCPTGHAMIREFARQYLEENGTNYSLEDLIIIGAEQKRQILACQKVADAESIIVVDTWIYVLKIWAMDLFGEIPTEFGDWEYGVEVDAYILCSPDLPWEPDPIRENPHDRDRLFMLYFKALMDQSVPFVVAKGIGPERMENVLKQLADKKIIA